MLMELLFSPVHVQDSSAPKGGAREPHTPVFQGQL